jgi:DNA gyrase subunit A
MRAKADVLVDEKTGRESIVIHEIPYQVNKARLIEKIAELVKEKKIEGISELRDESTKDIRVVIELKRGESGDVVLNNLYAQTQLETVFGINTVALVDGQPKVLNLKELLEAFIRHRREVVTRRTVFELRKARQRGHILEGLAVALANIDEMIELIRTSATGAEAKERMMARSWALGDVSAMLERAGADVCRPEDLDDAFGVRDERYHLSPDQAQQILDMRLQKLTGLEHDKLIGEYKQIIDDIGEFLRILNSYERLMEVIREELLEVKDEFGDERKTEIMTSRLDLSMEDLITEEDMVVTISHAGYAKTQPLTDYEAQKRGGKGRSASSLKDDDFIEHLLVTSTHDTILCFSNFGKVYWLRVFEIPQASRAAKGRPMVNLLPLDAEERITAILPIREYDADHFIFMATASGTVKKTSLDSFSRPRTSGLIALSLDEGDHLVGVALTDGEREVMLMSDAGKVVRFKEEHVRAMGRTARGVRGISLEDGQKVISLIVPEEDGTVLTASERGYGKRTLISEFPTKGRGTKGVIGMVCSERNGKLVGAKQVFDGDEVMLISDQGTLVRTRVDEISTLGRNTQGVTLIRVAEDEKLVSLERIDEPDEEELMSDASEGATEEGNESASDDHSDDSESPETNDE